FSFLLCFVFYSNVYSQVLKESSYFPLQIDNQWFFSSQNDTLSETVADTQRIGGNLYYSFEKFRDFSGFLFRVFDNRVYIFADTSEYLWYDFNADSGNSWIVPPLGHPYNGGIFTMQSKTDTVVTPVESFTECYRIHHLIGADAEFVEWFAPGVGIVQRDVITIAGLRKWILVDRVITSVRTSTGFVIPKLYSLSQNYPNPFNPSTIIKYQIPQLSFVTIKVYDVLGSEIITLVNEEKPLGSYEVEFNAANLPSGIYFYRLQAGNFVETKKMVLMK
ncbi:MAG: T9SS type A sorting domain-containing protein, partial [Candidatus Kariarchaeaceae archaeon]